MLKRNIAMVMASVMALSALPVTAFAEESGEKVDLVVMCAYASEDPHGQYVYQYAEDYMAENPNVNIEIQAISSNDIYTKLAAMATSPDDLPTLFFTSVDQAPTLYDLGMMTDMKEYLSEEDLASFQDGIVDACMLDDMMAFYPIDVQPLAILYRTDRFEEAGLEVPTTWDEFVECAKALTADTDGDGEVDQWGFSMVGSNNSSGQSRFLSYLWSNGCNVASYDEENEEWVVDLGDNFTELLTRWTDMNNVDGVVPTGITEVDYATAANYFAMGYTSMMLTGSNAIGVAYANNPDLAGKIGSFVIPGGEAGTMLNAEGYAICSFASEEEKAAAVDFLKFFSTHDAELSFWQSSGKIPATIEGAKADYISGADYKGYLDTVANGCIAPVNFAGMSGLKSALGDAYAAVFSGEKTNEEATADLEAALEELMDDYN